MARVKAIWLIRDQSEIAKLLLLNTAELEVVLEDF